MNHSTAVTAQALLERVQWSPTLFERDLHDVSSLPDLSAELEDGRTWADIHFAVLTAGLRWECSLDGMRSDSMLSPEDLAVAVLEHAVLLKVWIGQLQLNCHYFSLDSVEFDVEVSVLRDPDQFDCLAAFMDWLSVVTGSTVRLSPEGANHLTIWSTSMPPATAIELVRDRLRLRDLMHTPFGSVRGVIAPLAQIDEANVDAWLATHPPEAVTAVLSHVHLWDCLDSTDDEAVLDEVAQVVARCWRESLARQFPERTFEVGVAGEPDEYGPTVWVEARPSAG
jgi:hypothetical protein